DTTLMWRRRMSPERLWLGVDGWARWRMDTSIALGVDLRAHRRRLPWGLRADIRARYARQRIELCCATWTAQGKLSVDRAFNLAPSLWVIPALRLEAEHYQISEGSESRRDDLDTRVFSSYGRDHSRVAAPRVSLYWLPFQDQVGVLSFQTASNADLRSLDYLSASATWRGLAEVRPLRGPFYELGYRVSWRLRDEHRASSYVRHDLGLSLTWAAWRGRTGRLLIGVEDRVFLSLSEPTENIVRAFIRLDWTAGRGLRDFFPSEIAFDDLDEPRLWSWPD
ncbi:MAG: hypothetical protein AAGC55_22735, partial [Myxococcota bacterium]